MPENRSRFRSVLESGHGDDTVIVSLLDPYRQLPQRGDPVAIGGIVLQKSKVVGS